MPRPRPEAIALSEQYRLAVRMPAVGNAGQVRGKNAGASVEFLDHRSYIPGDDVRHLDWRAFARTDRLLIKRYQEEVRPTLEILVDGSASMATAASKAALTIDVVALLIGCARADGWLARVTRLGDRPEPIAFDRFMAEGLDFTARTPLQETTRQAAGRLRPGSLCVLLSDFLSPASPGTLVRPLQARAGRFALVQILSKEDAQPTPGGAIRLEDAETGEVVDLVLDRAAISAYLQRLRLLSEGLRDASVRGQGVFASLRGDQSLATSCRDVLVRAGLLRVL